MGEGSQEVSGATLPQPFCGSSPLHPGLETNWLLCKQGWGRHPDAVALGGFGEKQQQGTQGKWAHFSQPHQPVIYWPGGDESQEITQEPPSPAPGVLHILFLSSGRILGLIRVPETPRGRESQPLVTPPLRKRLPSSVSSRLLLIFPFWFLLQGKPC